MSSFSYTKSYPGVLATSAGTSSLVVSATSVDAMTFCGLEKTSAKKLLRSCQQQISKYLEEVTCSLIQIETEKHPISQKAFDKLADAGLELDLSLKRMDSVLDRFFENSHDAALETTRATVTSLLEKVKKVMTAARK